MPKDPKNPYPTKADATDAPAPAQRTSLPARDKFDNMKSALYSNEPNTTPEEHLAQSDTRRNISVNFAPPDYAQEIMTKYAKLDEAAKAAVAEKNAYSPHPKLNEDGSVMKSHSEMRGSTKK